MDYANILTGGIGCGKSTVASLLMLEGFKIIDADAIAHDILQQNATLIQKEFGNDILEDGIIQRKKLGLIIFNDSQKRLALESILHPLIQKEIINQCCLIETKKKPYFIEIPLFFESKFQYPAKFITCVYAPKNLQMQRIIERNALSQQEAHARIQAQMDIEEKRRKSTFVIENTGDLKTLQKNVEKFLQEFQAHW